MYFRDRSQAGELLANQLLKYRYENTAVVALSAAGVVVGEQIAKRLHCSLSILMTRRISAPLEPSLTIGTIDQAGNFTYNDLIPAGEMEEYLEDMRNYLEEAKLHELYEMASLLGDGGLVDRASLVGRNVILATDGVKTGISFEAALQFLKTIPTEKIIGAVPVGPAEVIERINVKVDELHYLYIPENFFSPSHYYEDNTIPDPQAILSTLNQIVHRWV